jgi:transglutaminase-like putative cysteine protease
MPLLHLHHLTTYRHASPFSGAWQLARLQPRRERGQELLAFELDVQPRPADLAVHDDYFGNTVHAFTITGAHLELSLTATSRVRRDETVWPMAGLTMALGAARAEVAAAVRRGEFGLEQFRAPSPLVPALPEAAELVAGLDAEDPPALAWLLALGARMAERFAFDPHATTVATPLVEVLRGRRGVCQDFAHATIAAVRAAGLPAAYVSGYLLTHPPPGQPRLLGADAMHAWVAVWIAGTGWVDFDPTNNSLVSAGHVVVARGRDYGDVAPVRGLFRGGGQHTLSIGVTVQPIDDPTESPPGR